MPAAGAPLSLLAEFSATEGVESMEADDDYKVATVVVKEESPLFGAILISIASLYVLVMVIYLCFKCKRTARNKNLDTDSNYNSFTS